MVASTASLVNGNDAGGPADTGVAIKVPLPRKMVPQQRIIPNGRPMTSGRTSQIPLRGNTSTSSTRLDSQSSQHSLRRRSSTISSVHSAEYAAKFRPQSRQASNASLRKISSEMAPAHASTAPMFAQYSRIPEEEQSPQTQSQPQVFERQNSSARLDRSRMGSRRSSLRSSRPPSSERLGTPGVAQSVLQPLQTKLQHYEMAMEETYAQILQFDRDIHNLQGQKYTAELKYHEVQVKRNEYQRHFQNVEKALRGEPQKEVKFEEPPKKQSEDGVGGGVNTNASSSSIASVKQQQQLEMAEEKKCFGKTLSPDGKSGKRSRRSFFRFL